MLVEGCGRGVGGLADRATTSRSIRPSPGLGATAAAPGWWRCHWRRGVPRGPRGLEARRVAVGHHSRLERPLEQVERRRLWSERHRLEGRSRPLPRRASGEQRGIGPAPEQRIGIGQQPARTQEERLRTRPGRARRPPPPPRDRRRGPPPHSEARRARARHRAWAAPRPPGRLPIARSSPRQCSSRPPVKASTRAPCASDAPRLRSSPFRRPEPKTTIAFERSRPSASPRTLGGRRRGSSPSRAQAASAARSARERCHWPSTGVNRPAG